MTKYSKDNIIIKFTENNKEYIVLKKDNKIDFGYLKNREICLELTEEEKAKVTYIYNLFTINMVTSINCGTYKIEGKSIQIYLDKKSGLYFFYELKGNNLTIPDESTLKLLNMHYNNTKEALFSYIDCGTHEIETKKVRIFFNEKTKLYSFMEEKDGIFIPLDQDFLNILNKRFNNISNELEEKLLPKTSEKQKTKEKSSLKDAIKITLKMHGACISVIVAAALAFQLLPTKQHDKLVIHAYKFMNDKQSVSEEEYSLKKLTHTLNNNSNLTEEERNFILETVSEQLEENKEYINADEIYKNLGNIDINYYKEDYPKISDGSYVAGLYKPDENDIIMYKSDNFNSSNKDTLSHEINHSLTVNWEQFEMGNLKTQYFLEMANELFSREYNYPTEEEYYAYYEFMPVMYALCEILEEDTIKKYKYDNQLKYIIDNLLKIDNDEQKAYQLITSTTAIRLYSENVLKAKNDEEKLRALDEEYLNKENIYNLIKNYYEKKYHRDMNKDKIMKFYLSDFSAEAKAGILNFLGSIPELNGDLSRIKIKPKAYISDKAKEENKSLKVIVTNQKGDKTNIFIDDSNRFSNDINDFNITKDIDNVEEDKNKNR